MPPNKLAALLSIVLLLSGCAVGVTHQLDTAVPTVRTTGKDSAFVVSSHDQRPYVRSGAKPESFVGLSRGGFGNPFDVNTASGNGLASDISKALANALSANGAQVEIIAVTPHEQETVVLSKLAARKVKAVLVTISILLIASMTLLLSWLARGSIRLKPHLIIPSAPTSITLSC